jgi:hypothetical protein
MIVINGLKNIYTNLREDERELAVKTIISAVQPTWTCDVAEPYSVYLYNNNIDIDWFKPDNQLHWNLVRQYLQQLERMVKNEKK